MEKRKQNFIEMCFDPSTNAHAKLKEILKKMLEEKQIKKETDTNVKVKKY